MANLTKSLVMPNGSEYEFIGRTWYGTCSTSASAQIKIVTIFGFASSDLIAGTRIVIRFTNMQSYNGVPYLNVSGTNSQLPIYLTTEGNVAGQYEWKAGAIIGFIYYNNSWIIEDGIHADTMYWGKTKLTNTISDTSTFALTPKAVYDAGYQTTTQVNALIGSAIGNITSFETAVVQTLPTTAISTNTIYFTPNSGTATNAYDEYMYINSQWEKIGTTDIDLSGYLQDSDIAAWAKEANKPTYTATEVGALPSTTTYVSSFNGSTGAITYTAPVTSVNGATGTVSLSASDVGAVRIADTNGIPSYPNYEDNVIYYDVHESINQGYDDHISRWYDLSIGVNGHLERLTPSNYDYVCQTSDSENHDQNTLNLYEAMTTVKNEVGDFSVSSEPLPNAQFQTNHVDFHINTIGMQFDISDDTGESNPEHWAISNGGIFALTNGINIAGHTDTAVQIHSLRNPTSNYDAANKLYVDSAITTATSAFQTATQVNALIASAVTSTYSATSTNAMNGIAVNSALSALSIPTVESTTNVAAMLTSLGLNSNANLSSALAGSAELDSAVVTHEELE